MWKEKNKDEYKLFEDKKKLRMEYSAVDDVHRR
jgi:hypothetical protein